jgi:glycosyltransferase involved in cell wall biosynthesis
MPEKRFNHSLRICLLGYRSNPNCGGQGVYLRNLSRALRDLGHRVDVVSGPEYPVLDHGVRLIKLPGMDLYNPNDLFRMPTITEIGDWANFVEWFGIATMGFSEPLAFGIRARAFLKNKAHCYDVIHDNQSLAYGLWAIKRRIPTVATIHHPITVDRALDIKAEIHPWRKFKQLRWYSFISMQKRVARTLSHLITVSRCARNDICRDFGIRRERFNIVPNGINTNFFYPLPEIEREKNRIIVTNSADTPLKGLFFLLQAIAKLSEHRDIRLTVVGTPRKNSQVARLIRDLGIGSRINFTGRISHDAFVRQYARATVAVIPSVYEGFGLPAGEAMACGIPVISTTGGALPEVVGDAGLLVPPADADALAGAIAIILDQPDLAGRLGAAGYKRVQEHLTWEAAARKTVEVYQKAIHDHHRF